jgi:hypothetical protein
MVLGHDIGSPSLLVATIDHSHPIEVISMTDVVALVTSWQRVAP